ncbi:glycoside hydrolase family 3 C-terminal domain-containing protein [Streptomyces sp. NA02950]|uniref:glycoside hydrolase family 3 N-terminal domain-containing protein n=1 Tax=Streptomyces sp. NA02950 TaxID=2742137 RepID=UPI0015922D8F|nr:glycoside hydrolase family 3 N-terminal domain-containing protein [Streptomyces sp. NA02950]QKV96511.1 glycoside hydrolase family 3 C-terminal domain-containing protein [Streptomyces sp. NA02950]
MDGVRRRTVLGALGGTVAAGGAVGRIRRRESPPGPPDGVRQAPERPRPYEPRVQALLGRMTVDEKLGQLQQLAWSADTGPGAGQNAEAVRAARGGRLGSVLNLYGARKTNALQRIAVEESRLGVPLLFGLDVIHGLWTTFPIPLAQAASFDPAVAGRDAEVSAREARSNGVNWAFSPMLDVTHEPRWGRIAEGNGEDPYLTAALGAAKVRGYQGDDLADNDRVAACAKHLAAYGGAEGGRDYNSVDVSEARLRNLYLGPFAAAVEAEVATVMAAFNTVSGIPAHANRHLLTDILKEQWQFDGVVVSDYIAIRELTVHGYAAGGADAARMALNAGVDMEMASTLFVQYGKRLLRNGRITMARLDDAVARVLRLKFRLGLFRRPYVDEDAAITEPTAAARSAARETAARSMVLLRNHKSALPLSTSARSIAVVGPFGDSPDLKGSWAGPWAVTPRPVTVADAIKAAVPKAKVTHVRGVDAQGRDTDNIVKAVSAARAAEVTVVVVGEGAELSGEARVRSDISLPGKQEELIEAIAKSGAAFVVVLVNGRPLTIGGWLESAPAVLEAWHPGIEGGHAIADVLFGKVNPGGKLPVSFPRAVGQVPIHYNHENTGRPYDPHNPYTSRYLDLPDGPQFAFGHGLSYTTFDIGEPRLSVRRIAADALCKGDTVQVAVAVRNTGRRTGDEVVQLYLRDPVASIVQPVRRLCGFRRVTLDAGKSTTVRFRLSAEDLGFWTHDRDGNFAVEKGEIRLYAGNSSLAGGERTLTIT